MRARVSTRRSEVRAILQSSVGLLRWSLRGDAWRLRAPLDRVGPTRSSNAARSVSSHRRQAARCRNRPHQQASCRAAMPSSIGSVSSWQTATATLAATPRPVPGPRGVTRFRCVGARLPGRRWQRRTMHRCRDAWRDRCVPSPSTRASFLRPGSVATARLRAPTRIGPTDARHRRPGRRDRVRRAGDEARRVGHRDGPNRTGWNSSALRSSSAGC